MRLSDFILDHSEAILQAWEDFARSVDTPIRVISPSQLRDHAEVILRTIALDMRTAQTEQQQIDKSHGLAPAEPAQTAAQSHAVHRLMDGYSLEQMVSEYRALRSSVLRLWLTEELAGNAYQVADIIRFNEAIDQALVESITFYGRAVETTRKTVLGVLGHDLRSPLCAVLMGADLLRKTQRLAEREKRIACQIAASVRRANEMVNDLLDLARCNLGNGIPVKRELTELNGLCAAIVQEVRAGHPQADIIFNDTDKVVGRFDPERMAQVFANLIGNAVRHGDKQRSIQVNLKVVNDWTVFSVRNFGTPIPERALPFLFNPEGRYSRYANDKAGAGAGLGLGLFIAAEIVAGHGGRVEVSSTAELGMLFQVLLPVTRGVSTPTA